MTSEDEGRAAAEQFRREHALGVQPLGDLVAIIEQATGIDVAVLDADPDQHGLTMRDPVRGSVIIGVASTPHPMRQRSTLAHELGHVLFEDWASLDPNGTRDPSDWSERTPVESRADSFARHLLVPGEGLRAFMADRPAPDTADLSAIVQRFLVSPAVAAIALHQIGHISAARKDEWMRLSTPQLATRYGWRDHYQALQADSSRRRAPQRLLARAVAGYQAGVVSAQTIAILRGIPLAKAEQELAQAGITPISLTTGWVEPDELPTVQVDLDALDDDLSGPDDTEPRGTAHG